MKKIIVTLYISLLFLFFISTVFFVQSASLTGNISFEGISYKTYYVGGTGPGNFTRIQRAINFASSGDCIKVCSGDYDEKLIISKSIRLIGEQRNTTRINGDNTGDVILLLEDNITVTGFTIQYSGDEPMYDAGIEIRSDNAIISQNNLCFNGKFGVGIYLNHSNGSIITGNNIHHNGNEGIYAEHASDNIISSNKIFANNHTALVLSYATDNIVLSNTIYANHCGISIWPHSKSNTIMKNKIFDHPGCGMGIWENSDSNNILYNRFENNSQWGIGIYSANKNSIHNNTLSGSINAIVLSKAVSSYIHSNLIENNSLSGISITENTTNAQIKNNLLQYNEYGICMQDSHHSQIKRNSILHNENGIYLIRSTGNSIQQNQIENKWTGIQLENAVNNTIHKNNCCRNADGIYLYQSFHNTISANLIDNNYWFGMWISHSNKNKIKENIISNNDDIGIYVSSSKNNMMIQNWFTNNDDGIYLECSTGIFVKQNVFKNLKLNAYVVAKNVAHCHNIWRNNLWDHPRLFPYPIRGKMKLDQIQLPIISFDWNPVYFQQDSEPNTNPSFTTDTLNVGKNNILYVGGNGLQNYSCIQSAVDEAIDGDVIFVYNGTYHENIIVATSITIQGENKENTIIDGMGYGDIITCAADAIHIEGLTIQNGHYGIYACNTSQHQIRENIIAENLHGISLWNSLNVTIEKNSFEHNQYGVRFYQTALVSMHYNNFESYKRNAYFIDSNTITIFGEWNRNFWTKPISGPYPIMGKKSIGENMIPWCHFDWKPLNKPYDSAN